MTGVSLVETGLRSGRGIGNGSSRPEPVLTKLDFVRRYSNGEFGNASPTWDTIDNFLYSDYQGLVHIRNRVAGAETWYNVPANEALYVWKEAVRKYDHKLLYVSAMAPTEKTLIQGEVQQSIEHLDLTYTTVRKPMRDALRERTQYASGMIASSLLQYYLCPNSWDWMQYLLNAYPNHVIEFSCYDTFWGTLPNYNTVYWECRLY